MAEGCSFVTMNADKVALLARKCIERIEAKRQSDREGLIALRREEYERSWIRRLFRMGVPSDKEIEAELRSRREFFISSFDIIDASYREQEALARRLLKAAKYAAAIQVSVGDLAQIE